MFNLQDASQTDRPRARDLGVPFDGTPGKWNAITGVPGVEVGYSTIVEDSPQTLRTGVTTILPRGAANLSMPCAAGVSVLNGNGELTGRSWIEEAGQLQTPIAITNSHAVGTVHRAIDEWIAQHAPEAAAQWLLPVVGETWDGYLNSINEECVTKEHVFQALDTAAAGPLEEGNVGGGTGMNCYGFKGGTGTASRVVRAGEQAWTVGVLLQANFGGRQELRVQGRRLGLDSQAPNPMDTTDWFTEDLAPGRRSVPGAGSVIVVVITDAPLLPAQCEALARRVPLGLARTGTTSSHFSGDISLALSTGNPGALRSRMGSAPGQLDELSFVAWGAIDPLYAAVVEATEEAVVNALIAAEDMVGRNGHKSFALPHEEVRAAFA